MYVSRKYSTIFSAVPDMTTYLRGEKKNIELVCSVDPSIVGNELVADLIKAIGCFHVDRNFIENENVFAEFFQANCVRFDITEDSIEIVFVNAKEMRVVFVENDARRSDNVNCRNIQLDIFLFVYLGELLTKLNLPKSSPSWSNPTIPLP